MILPDAEKIAIEIAKKQQEIRGLAPS